MIDSVDFDCSSPQTRSTFLEQQQKVRDHRLSVIMDEEDSQYFEESEWESQYNDDVVEAGDTLKEGK